MQVLSYRKELPFYELFFAPLCVNIEPGMLESIRFAYFVSKFGSPKERRDDGSRSFDHPKTVAWIGIYELECFDPRFIIDALLHDISEDFYLMSLYRIKVNFGAEIAFDVRALTKLSNGKESTREYLERVINRGPQAITAKLCDRLHNLRTLEGCSREKQEKQGTETREFHLPLLIPALHSHGDVWYGYAKKLEKEMLKAMEYFGV